MQHSNKSSSSTRQTESVSNNFWAFFGAGVFLILGFGTGIYKISNSTTMTMAERISFSSLAWTAFALAFAFASMGAKRWERAIFCLGSVLALVMAFYGGFQVSQLI